MKSVKKRGHLLDTRSRLLESACELFASKGYRDATLAEICERAAANIAAANYYFRDKETLYVQAWRLSFQRSLEAYPADGGVSPDASPEERLRGRIISILRRVHDPTGCEFDMIYNELLHPTGLLAEVMRESVEPIRHGLAVLTQELLGEGATDMQVQLCHMSIRSQCFDFILRKRRQKLQPELEAESLHPYLDVDVETLADHILDFSLAGIREIRQPTRRRTNGAARNKK